MILLVNYVNKPSLNVLDKSKNFKFTIGNYNENLDLIKKEGKSYFPILEKKQDIRIKFINKKKKKNEKYNEKEDIYSNHSCYNCLILTINLKQFLIENTSGIKNNDLQQNLINISVLTFNYPYKNKSNLKVVIYYFANLFFILFKEMKDVNHYLSIENKYLNKIKSIVDETSVFLEGEFYPFLKINIFVLGELFKKDFNEKKNIISKKENQNIIIEYFIKLFIEISPLIIENYLNIKKASYDLSSGIKSSIISNITLVDNNVLNNEQYQDFEKLIEYLYDFLTNIVTDLSKGKEIYNTMDLYFKKDITDNLDFNKYVEEILIYLYKHIIKQNQKSKILIFSLIEFICVKVLEDLKLYKDYYFEILIYYFNLIIDDDLKEKTMKLFAQIFIEEIKLDNYNDSFFLKFNELNPRNTNKKKFEYMIPFLSYISEIYINLDENMKIKVLKKLTESLDKYTDENLFNYVKKESNTVTIFHNNDYIIVFSNFNIFKYNEKENGLDLIHQYFKFYITFLLFINSNFNLLENEINLQERKIVFEDIISKIYKLEFLSTNSNEFIPYISSLINILIYYIKVYCISYVNSSYIIYKLLSKHYKTFLNEKLENYSYIPYLLYYSTIFIFINLIKIYKLQISFIIIHNDIIENINNLNNNYSNLLNQIDINDLITNDFNKEMSEKFENDLKTNFNVFENFDLDQNSFNRIIDIMYSKIFGNSSELFSFMEPQIKNLEKKLDGISINNQTEVISEGKNLGDSFFNNLNLNNDISNELKANKNLNNSENNINTSLNNLISLNPRNIIFTIDDYNLNNNSNLDSEGDIKY